MIQGDLMDASSKHGAKTTDSGPALPAYPFKHEGLVLQDGNKAVLSVRHMCGYVTLPADKVPKEWHGHYDADGLQYLAIHGGITYCEVGGGDEAARHAASKAAYEAQGEAPDGDLDSRVNFYTNRRKAADAAKLTVPYEYVTFGFDCAHAGDEENYNLSDAEYVMGLVRQMEQQLLEYAAIIPAWRAADREGRAAMMDKIIALAPVKCDMGFGALIGMLSGAPAGS